MLLGITEKEFELEHGLILLTNNTQRLVKDLQAAPRLCEADLNLIIISLNQ